MEATDGEYVWKVRSTPSPLDTLRTMKLELRLRLRLAMTTPSNAWTRLRVPSTTLTLTITVSPGANAGIVRLRRAISSRSRVWIMSTEGSCDRARAPGRRLAGRRAALLVAKERGSSAAEDRKTRNYSFARGRRAR